MFDLIQLTYNRSSRESFKEKNSLLLLLEQRIKLFESAWIKDYLSFTDLVPIESDINPFVLGLTGYTTLVDKNRFAPIQRFAQGNRSKTIYEFLNDGENERLDLDKKVDDLFGLLNQVKEKQNTNLYKNLNDTPDGYFGEQFLMVNPLEIGVFYTDMIPSNTTFIGLSDTPDNYNNAENQVVIAKTDLSGVEFKKTKDIHDFDFLEAPEVPLFDLQKGDLANKVIYVRRDQAVPTVIQLGSSLDGAEVIFRNSDDTIGVFQDVQFTSFATDIILESAFVLNDTQKSIHLVYETSTKTFWAIGD